MSSRIAPPAQRSPRPPIGRLRRCDRHERLAAWTVHVTGGRWGFRVAVLAFLAWGAAGPYFAYGEAWRTTFFLGTSSVTFLTILLARNAQGRSSKALHLKLDELILAARKADDGLIEADDLSECELDEMREGYLRRASRRRDPGADRGSPHETHRRAR